MSEKIKAFIVNRNLVNSLRDTVTFLLREPRVEVVIFDQDSTYPPLLEYYKNSGVKIIYSNINGGPHSTWGLSEQFNDNYFIVADSDCNYKGVPKDWLDVMINVLENSGAFKVGFSLQIDDLPDREFTQDVLNTELRYWNNKNDFGYIADVDTTFALYRPHSPFSYRAVRLDKPYCIKHVPWYITKENISEEWRYYLETASGISTWGSKLKNLI